MTAGFTRADLRKGAFEIACHRDGRAQYVVEPCYLIGPFAIHRDTPRGWRVSHAASGVGVWCDPRTLAEALAFVNAIAGAIRWREITRGVCVGQIKGMSRVRWCRVGGAIKRCRRALGRPTRYETVTYVNGVRKCKRGGAA